VTITVVLPGHLRELAHAPASEVVVPVEGPATQRTLLDGLETIYPALRGAIREHGTMRRRAFIRFFACSEDISFESPDAPLPAAVAEGREPFLVVGAVAGG
jgi:hypothetical protein